MFNFMLEDFQMSLQQDEETRDRLQYVLTCPCLIHLVAFCPPIKGFINSHLKRTALLFSVDYCRQVKYYLGYLLM